MSIDRISKIRSSEIIPESIYQRRRELIRAFGLGIPALLTGCSTGSSDASTTAADTTPITGNALTTTRNDEFQTDETVTSYKDLTHYNNYYEFGTDKADPARNSSQFQAHPWAVEIRGLAEVTGTFTLEDILKNVGLEERIYRMRCVEGWSMVIPWVGFPLATLLRRFKPLASAKYVAFTTVHRPSQMPGLGYPSLDWPYREGLRLDEAMHPLTILAVGVYGHELPNQNGAPLRLVVPWKYGFKGIKSIVKMEFVETQPYTSWNAATPSEYGFYSNVNPEVDHPRWTQGSERRISGTGLNLFASRIETKKFNGYGDQVANLYAGMDLRRYF